MLRTGYKLTHPGYPMLSVIGNVNDVEFEKITGRLAWRLKGRGNFIICRVQGIEGIVVNDDVVSVLEYSWTVEDLPKPICVRGGSVLELRGPVNCSRCNDSSANRRIIFGLCEDCGRRAGMHVCRTCGRWTDDGSCCSNRTVGMPRWVTSFTHCQFGVARYSMEDECREEKCFNCPWLSEILGERKLNVVVLESTIEAWSDDNRVRVMLYNGVYEKKKKIPPSVPKGISTAGGLSSITITYTKGEIPRVDRLKIMERVTYLWERGLAVMADEDWRAVAAFLDARVPAREMGV